MGGPFPWFSPVEIPAIIFNAVAKSDFFDHLQVIQGPLFESFCLQVFRLFLKEGLLFFQILLDFPYGLIGCGLARDEQICRVNDDVVKRDQTFACFGIDRFQPFDFIPPELNTQRMIGISQEYIYRVPLNAEGSPFELGTRSAVQAADEGMQESVAPPFLTDFEWNHAFVKFHWIANSVNAADGGDHNDIAPATQQGRGGAETQFLNLLIDSQVLFDVRVRGGDIGLGLIVIVVADEILDQIVREELLEFAVQLRGQRFVMAEHEGRTLGLSNDIGNRKRLA